MMQPYPAYKNAGVPWLGEIPEHWEVFRGKNLLKKMERAVRKQDEVITCFRDGMVTLRKNRRTSGFTESLKEIGYQGIRKGDLVIHQMDAFAGAIGVSDSDGKGTPVYSVCCPLKDSDTRYYAHLLREMARAGFILSLAKGIRERSTDFRFSTFAALLLPFPPPAEQKQIAAFLDWKSAQIQRLIDNKQQQMAKLKAYKQSMIHRAVTRGLNPAVKFKPSGVPWLGDIPEHWEVAPLKHLTFINSRVLSETTDQHYSFKYVDISSVGSGDLVANPETMQFHQAPSRARRILQQGDTIISTVRTYLKAVYYVADDVQDWVASTGFAVLTPKQEIFPPFLSLLVQGDQFINLVIRQSVGVAYPAISETKLGALYVAYPELDEQKQIVEYLEQRAATLDRAIDRAAQEIQLLAEYRTRLIADVVTGKLDVRAVALPPNETAH